MAGGRPTSMTQAVLQKLEYAFACAMSDKEASLYAGIAPATLYSYCDKNPEFAERKELLKKQPNITAKINMHGSLNAGDLDNSKWWLERKCKDEFSTKQSTEHTGPNGGAININVLFESGPSDETQE